jgi:hypothetical protein
MTTSDPDHTLTNDRSTNDRTRQDRTLLDDELTYGGEAATRYSPPGVAGTTETQIVDRSTYVGIETADAPMRDRVRWGAVWAGLLVAVSSYLVLQLALVSVGLIDVGAPEASDAWWSAGAALLAFFLGGVTTGATAMWDHVTDGVLHGIVMWAIGVVGLLVLSVASSGLTLGALDATGVFDDVRVDIEEAIDESDADSDVAEEAASWVLLGLGAALFAAVVGGMAGAKLWSGRPTDARDRRDGDRRIGEGQQHSMR